MKEGSERPVKVGSLEPCRCGVGRLLVSSFGGKTINQVLFALLLFAWFLKSQLVDSIRGCAATGNV